MNACESCRSQARQLVRSALRASANPRAAGPATQSLLPKITAAAAPPRRRQETRSFSSSAPRRILGDIGGAIAKPYMVVASTERLYKVCGEAADYHITEQERKKDEVKKLDDGEEVGHSKAARDVWHTRFGLPPTFSTWSHVTMLHLYLLNARVRCFERDVYRQWQQQLVDHFFFDAEKKMHVDHHITSSALRQRYLRDIFVQWRGLLLAYDEGLVKGDAVLASAVWRNLFKGDPGADPRSLAAVVGWMRGCLQQLELTSDFTFPTRAPEILREPVTRYWDLLEKGLRPRDVEEVAEDVEAQRARAAASKAATSKFGADGEVGTA